MKTSSTALLLGFTVAFAASGCGDDSSETPVPDATPGEPDAAAGEPDGGGGLTVPDTYAFESRFVEGSSSVSYTGQSFRHVLVSELSAYIEALTTAIDSGASPGDGETLAALDFYYEFDPTTGGEVELTLSTTPGPVQTTFGAFNSDAKLGNKVAGQEIGNPVDWNHADWSTDFVGWQGAASPAALVQSWFEIVDDLAYQRGLGDVPLDPDGNAIAKVYVTAEGQDLKQLLQKFLLMSIAFHQATDKYLDSATDGVGLRSPNTRSGESAYTSLEHAWDEGFGYFGAARDYKLHDDTANASPGYFDANEDGAIDLKSEYNFGASVNAVKRDQGSDASAPTDFSGDAIDAFLRGRAIIADAGDTLTSEELAELESLRDAAVDAWEKAIAATIIHYINANVEMIDAFETDYVFLDHAKEWSEMKGFALGLQFNPRSPLTGEQFAELHTLFGDAPVLPNADPVEIAAYRQALLDARAILADAYDFAEANVNGW